MNEFAQPAAPSGDPEQPYAAPQYAAPKYAAPQYAAPQYAAPQQYPQQFATPQQYVAHYVAGPGEPFDGAVHAADITRPLYGANIGQAFIRFFKNYASFSGRASRSEFWWVILLYWGSWIASGTVFGIIEDASYGFSTYSYDGFRLVSTVLGIVTIIIFLGVCIPFLALTWRRLHDANLPGPFFFLSFAPVFGGIALIVLLCLPPRPEGRRFTRFN